MKAIYGDSEPVMVADAVPIPSFFIMEFLSVIHRRRCVMCRSPFGLGNMAFETLTQCVRNRMIGIQDFIHLAVVGLRDHRFALFLRQGFTCGQYLRLNQRQCQNEEAVMAQHIRISSGRTLPSLHIRPDRAGRTTSRFRGFGVRRVPRIRVCRILGTSHCLSETGV